MVVAEAAAQAAKDESREFLAGIAGLDRAIVRKVTVPTN
jgi:hypothetical protein